MSSTPLPSASDPASLASAPPGPRSLPALLGLWLLTTLTTLGAARAGYVMLEGRVTPSGLGMWQRWDTVHFVSVARDGYSAEVPRVYELLQLPVFPVLIRIAGMTGLSLELAALLVANLALAVAMLLLERLAEAAIPGSGLKAVIALLAFPTAFVLHAGYSEPVFLALVLGSLHMARRGSWLGAGLLGLLATNTRLVGLALGPALAVEYLAQRRFRLSAIRPGALWIGLVPAGLGTYLALNHWVTGDPFTFLGIVRDHFHRTSCPPWVGMMNAFQNTRMAPPNSLMLGWAELAAGIGGWLVIGLALLRRQHLAYPGVVAFGFTYWLLITAGTFWISFPRYLLGLVPLFLLLGDLGRSRPWLVPALLFAGLPIQGVLLVQFVRGWWAF